MDVLEIEQTLVFDLGPATGPDVAEDIVHHLSQIPSYTEARIRPFVLAIAPQLPLADVARLAEIGCYFCHYPEGYDKLESNDAKIESIKTTILSAVTAHDFDKSMELSAKDALSDIQPISKLDEEDLETFRQFMHGW